MNNHDLRARVAALEALVAQLTAASQRAAADIDLPAAPPDRPTSRRHLLKIGGAAALGAAGAAVARVSPAAAANGEDLVLGSSANEATGATGLEVQGTTAAYGFGVTDNGLSAYPSGLPEGAIFGYAAGQAFGSGVVGYASLGTGVLGYGEGEANGITARSVSSIGLIARGGQAPLMLNPESVAPPARTDTHYSGEIVCDADAQLWFCVDGGGPGTWQRLAGPSGVGLLTVLPSPVRVYDSRAKGTGPATTGDGPLEPGAERTVSLANGYVGTTAANAVPAGANAALFTLTAADTGTGGFLAAFSNTVSYPGTSNLNWYQSNSAIATAVTSAIDPAAKLKIHCGGLAGGTDFIIDVTGYYQ